MKKRSILIMTILLALCASCGSPGMEMSAPPPSEIPTPIDSVTPSPTLPSNNTRRPATTLRATESSEGERPSPEIYPPLTRLLSRPIPGDNEIQFRTSMSDEPFPVDIEYNDQPEFRLEDMIAGDIRPNMTQEEVVDILGLPDAVYQYADMLGVYQRLLLYYPHRNVLEFRDTAPNGEYYLLYSATVFADLPGPRGISIGDPMEKVFQSFKVDMQEAFKRNSTDSVKTILYCADFWEPIPRYTYALTPSGYIEDRGSEDASWLITYDCPAYPYAIDDFEYRDDYLVMPKHFLSFTIEDGKVAGYRWEYSTNKYLPLHSP